MGKLIGVERIASEEAVPTGMAIWRERILRVAPFAVFSLLAILWTAKGVAMHQADPAVLILAGLLIPIQAAALLVPWQRYPAGAAAAPIVAHCALVACLAVALPQQAAQMWQPLAILTAQWVALRHGRVEVAAAITSSMLVWLLPSAQRANGQVHTAGLAFWIVVGTNICLHVVATQARDRARTIKALRLVDFSMTGSTKEEDAVPWMPPRMRACEAAQMIGRADCVVLLEPGAPKAPFTVRTGSPKAAAQGAAGQVAVVPDFDNPHSRFISDVSTTLETRGLATVLHAASVLWLPVFQGDRMAAALLLIWHVRRREPTRDSRKALNLLAADLGDSMQRADIYAGLRHETRIDPLTGIANRRAWFDEGARLLTHCQVEGRSVYAGIIDFNDFKSVNDIYGHDVGDQLLSDSTAAWRDVLSNREPLARWGGEEFAFLLIDRSEKEAEAVVEQLKAAVPAGQSCAVGLVRWNESEPLSDLMDRADQEMYLDKRGNEDRRLKESNRAVEESWDVLAQRMGALRDQLVELVGLYVQYGDPELAATCDEIREIEAKYELAAAPLPGDGRGPDTAISTGTGQAAVGEGGVFTRS